MRRFLHKLSTAVSAGLVFALCFSMTVKAENPTIDITELEVGTEPLTETINVYNNMDIDFHYRSQMISDVWNRFFEETASFSISPGHTLQVTAGSIIAVNEYYHYVSPIKPTPEPSGDGTPSAPEPPTYEENVRNVVNAVAEATKNLPVDETTGAPIPAVVAVHGDEGSGSVPLYLMKTLKENPNVVFDLYFTYKGEPHRVIINSTNAIVDEEIEWFGAEYLLSHYPDMINAPEEAASTMTCRTYTVAEGDTIADIATKYGMSVDELLAKNPKIADRDLIFPGDVINY